MNNNNNPLVSIIVPVYNMEELLPKCLDSILNQTYDNIELVIVDDGSKDGSGSIADNYATNDKRVSVIHQQNQGIACALNTGLDNIVGDYFLFVDSDDYIGHQMVERLLSVIVEEEADIVQCERYSFPNKKGLGVIPQPIQKFITYNSRDEILEDFFHHKRISRNLAARMFRTALFEGIRCEPGRMIIDAVTLPRVLIKCNKYILLDERYYYVYETPTSASRSKYTLKKWDDCKFANAFIECFIKVQCPKYIDYVYYRYVYTTLYAYVAMMANKQEVGSKEILEESLAMFRQYYPLLCESDYYSKISQAQKKSYKRFYSTPEFYSFCNRIKMKVIEKIRYIKYEMK